jgi:hypothetical protein
MNASTSASDDASRRAQFLEAYRSHRIDDQIAYYANRSTQYERARRTTVTVSAALLVLAALFGALATAEPGRRSFWAFLAAAVSAMATAIVSYEAAFGFERLSREFGDTRAAVELAEVNRPQLTEVPDDKGDELVRGHVTEVEGILRAEVDAWSHVKDWPPTSAKNDD